MKTNAIGIVFCAVIALGLSVPNATAEDLVYIHAAHSKLQGEERRAVADQIIKLENTKKGYYPDIDTVFVAPTGSLKKVGLLMFDANIMRGGGKTPYCCANLYPLQGVQQIISERMLDGWKRALEKHATGDITLAPIDKISQSAAYQREGKPVKDYPNDKETSFFQKLDQALGFENVKVSFMAVPGGGSAPSTDISVPRGLRLFSWIGGTGAVAFKAGHGAAIRDIGLENGLDAALLVHSTFYWETDRAQSISNNMKGTAKMTISASMNVPNGRWEEAVKAINQRTYGVALSPAFRSYTIAFEDKVSVPYDQAAQNPLARCCREGMAAEVERDVFNPMLEQYYQVVDMIVERMVVDLRSTHGPPAK